MTCVQINQKNPKTPPIYAAQLAVSLFCFFQTHEQFKTHYGWHHVQIFKALEIPNIKDISTLTSHGVVPLRNLVFNSFEIGEQTAGGRTPKEKGGV